MIFFGQKKDVLPHDHQNGIERNHPNGQNQHQKSNTGSNNQHQKYTQSQNHSQTKRYPVLEKIGIAFAFLGTIILLGGLGVLGYGIATTIIDSNFKLVLIIAGGAGTAVGVLLLLLLIPICCKINSGSRKRVNPSPIHTQSRRKR